MRVLVIGAGGVGGAFAAIIARRKFASKLIIADVNFDKARAVALSVSNSGLEVCAESVDASSEASVYDVAQRHNADAIINLCAPLFNPPIFAAALKAGCTYIDTACNLSQPHLEKPYELMGQTLGVEQFAQSPIWEAKGQLALTGMGVEPGLSDVFARYAADH